MHECNNRGLVLPGLGRVKVRSSRQIRRGNANCGIYVHKVRRRVEGGWSKPLRVLEKRTTKDSEVEFARYMLKACSQEGGCAGVPEVYGVIDCVEGASIFMEYLVEIDESDSCRSDRIERVVIALKAFDEQFDSFFREKSVKKITRSWRSVLERALLQVESHGHVRDLLARFDLEARSLKKGRAPVCHNDLYWPNIIVSRDGCKFIDFGTVGRNVVGADLHHFLRKVKGPRSAALFEELAEVYSAAFQVELREVVIAARCMAVVKAAKRVHAANRGVEDDKVQSELEFIDWALSERT